MKQHKSKLIKMLSLKQGGSVFLQFIHSESGAVIADITTDSVAGKLKFVRETEVKWICLEDNIDRTALNALYNGATAFDIEEQYQKYALDKIVGDG